MFSDHEWVVFYNIILTVQAIWDIITIYSTISFRLQETLGQRSLEAKPKPEYNSMPTTLMISLEETRQSDCMHQQWGCFYQLKGP